MIAYLKPKRGPRQIKLYARVVRDMGLSFAEIGFLAFLKSYYGKLGIIPSADTIAADAACDRKTVFKHLKRLDDLGIITRSRRREGHDFTSNSYTIDDEMAAVKEGKKNPAGGPKNGPLACPKKRYTHLLSQKTVHNSTSEHECSEREVLERANRDLACAASEEVFEPEAY